MAPFYDSDFAYPPAMTARQADWLATHCQPGPMLDLGCGTGRMLEIMQKAGFWTAGLDCSPGMLALAREKNPEANLVLADARRAIPFAEGSFQSVFSLHAGLIHIDRWEDHQAMAREVFRVLKPGGLFVAELPHPKSFPPEPGPGRWRPFGGGILCRRLGPCQEELCLENLRGVRTVVRLIAVEEVPAWLSSFRRVELLPGFQGGKFKAEKGLTMVTCAWK